MTNRQQQTKDLEDFEFPKGGGLLGETARGIAMSQHLADKAARRRQMCGHVSGWDPRDPTSGSKCEEPATRNGRCEDHQPDEND